MSAEGVRVRPARPDDDAALLELERTNWDPGTGFPSIRERLLGQTTFFDDRHPYQNYLVAELGGAVAGYIHVRRAMDIPEAAHVFGIFGLLVTRQARGQGVASALLRAAEERAKANGGRKLTLGVFATNPTAIRLYERHGYVVEGRHRQAFLIDGEYVDDFEMAKSLS